MLIRHVAIMGFLNQMQRRGRDAAEVAASVNNHGTKQIDGQSMRRQFSLRLGGATF